MSKSTSIVIGDHFEGFIANQIARGRFGSASEVLRAGLRLLEAQEQELELTRRALEAGEASGISERNADDIIQSVIERRRANGTL